MCDSQNSITMPATEEAHQLIEPSDIKREPDIKEEPPSADLTEYPALNDCGDQQPITVKIENDCGDVPLNFNINALKIKEERGIWNAGETKTNKANGNGQQQDPARRNSRPNQNGITARQRNAKNGIGSDSRRSAQKQHRCKECGYSATYQCLLKRHLLKHMERRMNEFLFHCATCLKGFDEKNEKMKHEINCKYIRYECHVCKKSCGADKSNLIRHMCIHIGLKPFQCTECTKRFTRKYILKSHMKVHAGPRSFYCSKCRQGFDLQNDLIAHEYMCSRRVYECYICGKCIGMNKGHLEQHMRTHTGDKPFQCPKCPKKFRQTSPFNYHMKIHSRSLPWKCTICRQGFAQQSQWKVHQRNCTRRTYECHLCKKFFSSCGMNLRKHMTKHSGEKPFQCGICRNRFIQKGHLIWHIKTVHNKMRN